MAVSWGGPDELVATECSYCDAPIPEDDMPLRIWNEDSWAAVFCRKCQKDWWGMTTFDDDSDFDEIEPLPRRRRLSKGYRRHRRRVKRERGILHARAHQSRA